MRTTLILSATGLVFHSALASTTMTASYQTCSIDPVYQGLFGNSEVNYDASTFCLSLLGVAPVTSCVATETTRTTVAVDTMSTSTVTSTTAVAASTSHVVSTVVVFDIESQNPQKMLKARQAMVTMKPRYLRNAINAYEKRQVGNSSTYDLISALRSACECNPALSPLTTDTICTSTSTISQSVILRTVTTVYVTVTSGTTTVTDYVNSTSTIVTSTIPVNSTSTWTVPDTWTDWTTTTTTTTTTNITTSVTPVSVTSTTSTTNGTTTTTTTTTTSTSSGCPYNNGTTFNTYAQKCMIYKRVCGRSYADPDFYDLESEFDTPEECTSLCDAVNRGPIEHCVGIVWNTTIGAANCRVLKAIDMPIDSADSIALLLEKDPACNTTTTTTSMTSTTSTSSITTTPYTNTTSTTSTTTITTPYTNTTSTTSTTTSPITNGTTTSTETSTTTSQNMTTTTSPIITTTTISPNATTTTTTTTSLPSSSIITTSNSTCPITTVFLASTQYNTMFSTVTITLNTNDPSISTRTETQTITLDPVAPSTVTVTITKPVPAKKKIW